MRKSLYLAVVAGFVLILAAQPQPQVPVVQQNFRQKINGTPNFANKADGLAWGVLTVQDEVFTVQNEFKAHSAQDDKRFQTLQQSDADHESRLAKVEQGISPIVQHIHALEQQKFGEQIAALQKQLNEFHTAACPALKTAKLKDTEKTNLDKICQSDSAPAK
jgi:hypothetical protein